VNKLNTHFTHVPPCVADQLEVRFGTNFRGFVPEGWQSNANFLIFVLLLQNTNHVTQINRKVALHKLTYNR